MVILTTKKVTSFTQETGYYHLSLKIRGCMGRHGVYPEALCGYEGWAKDTFDRRCMFELISFVFVR